MAYPGKPQSLFPESVNQGRLENQSKLILQKKETHQVTGQTSGIASSATNA